MIPDLIYDVGMHDGEDTAYYLARGYRVVAIEANPAKVERAREQFAGAIGAGRLVLVHTGVFPVAGEFDFWISEYDFWSSFDRLSASKANKACVPVRVACRPLQDVLREHGVPYYLKIDVEGQEDHCLRALSPADLPRYVSWEAGLGSLAQLAWMHQLGYNAFKCIAQATLTASLKRHIAAGHLLGRALGRARREVARAGRLLGARATASPDGEAPREFAFGSSGPFGEDTDGAWQSFESVAGEWCAYCRKVIRGGPGTLDCWFDFHAAIR